MLLVFWRAWWPIQMSIPEQLRAAGRSECLRAFGCGSASESPAEWDHYPVQDWEYMRTASFRTDRGTASPSGDHDGSDRHSSKRGEMPPPGPFRRCSLREEPHVSSNERVGRRP